MTMFRVCPYDDYTTEPGAPLENILQQELEADADRFVAAVALMLCKMHAASMVSDEEVLSILNRNRRDQQWAYGEWEVVE
jgi:hypothetical protein